MKTVPLNMYEFLSYTGFTRRNTLFYILVAVSQEYVNTYSTPRHVGRWSTLEAAPPGRKIGTCEYTGGIVCTACLRR